MIKVVPMTQLTDLEYNKLQIYFFQESFGELKNSQ